jgi:proteic killer suppression protein
VIGSFRHKGLKELFETGKSRRIAPGLLNRIRLRLDAIHAAGDLAELSQPGFDFHPLRGKPKRYSIHVNGPVCITFAWKKGEALLLDLEQYH